MTSIRVRRSRSPAYRRRRCRPLIALVSRAEAPPRRRARTPRRSRRCRRWRSRSSRRRARRGRRRRARLHVHRRHVGAGLGFAQCERRDGLARRHARQVPCALLRSRPGQADRARPQALHRDREVGQARVARERLADQADRARVDRLGRAALRGAGHCMVQPAGARRARRTSSRHCGVDIVPMGTAARSPRPMHPDRARSCHVARRRRTASRGGSSRRSPSVALEHRPLLRDEGIGRPGWKSSVSMQIACACASASIACSIAHRPIPDAAWSW